MSCGCKKNCYPLTGCYMNITSAEIAPLQYYYGVTADGCWKFQLPPTQASIPVYNGCDGTPIANGQQIARCSEVDSKVATAVSNLRLVGCDNAPVPLATPVVKCSEFVSLFNTNLLNRGVGASVVYGSTLVLGSDGQFHLLTNPVLPTTNALSIAGGIVTSTVNGVVAQAVLPTDVQVSNATLSGTTLIITESNGDVNQVNLADILNGLIKCDGTFFNRLVDRVVTCSAFPALLQANTTNDVQLIGNVLQSTVNGVTDTVDLSSLANSAETPFVATGSATIDFTTSGVNGHNLTGSVKVSTQAGNIIQSLGDGIFAQSSAFSGITANAPFTGNGTVGNPLDINFSALQPSDLCAIGGVIPTGVIAQVVGKDALGCLVSNTLQSATTVSGNLVGTTLNVVVNGVNGAIDLSALSSGAETPLTANDSTSIDFTTSGVSNHTLTGVVKLSANAGNIIQSLGDGLFAQAGAFGGISANAPFTGNGTAGSPLDIDFTQLTNADRCAFGQNIPTGVIAQIVGKDAVGCLVGNTLASAITVDTNLVGTVLTTTINGVSDTTDLASLVSTPVETPLTANDSATIDFSTSGVANHTITGAVKVSANAGNIIQVLGDGLFAVSGGFTGAVVNAPITGNGTAGSPLDVDFSLISGADRCAIFAPIAVGTPTTLLGADVNGCPVKVAYDCACSTVAPLSSKAIGCLPSGGLGTVQMFERSSSCVYTF